MHLLSSTAEAAPGPSAARKGMRRGRIGHFGMKNMARRKRGSTADAIDCHVGSRIRERRIALGLNQQRLGEMIGLTHHQVHKYECGFNRVSAAKLFEIAGALSASITYFFEDIGQEGPRQITRHERMLLDVARNVAKIRNEEQREAVSELVRALAST
jgi:transcriptional regulator with XRE-family HTH domain